MRYAPTKIKAYATSYAWPYVLIAFFVLLYVGIDTVPNSAWDAEEGSGMDWPGVLSMFSFFGLAAAIIYAFIQSENGENAYRRKLSESKHTEPRLSIVAEPHGAKVEVYQISKSIEGTKKDWLRGFHAEDELDECLEFTAKEKSRVQARQIDERPAKQLAQTINKG